MSLYAALVTSCAGVFAMIGILAFAGALRWYHVARLLPTGRPRNDAFGNVVGALVFAAFCFALGAIILHFGGLS